MPYHEQSYCALIGSEHEDSAGCAEKGSQFVKNLNCSLHRTLWITLGYYYRDSALALLPCDS